MFDGRSESWGAASCAGRALLLLVALAGVLGAQATAIAAPAGYGSHSSVQAAGPPGSEPRPEGAAPVEDRSTRLAALQTELFDLDSPSLEAAAALRRSSDPRMLIDAVLLRAGRAIPPSVSAARRAQRAERAEEALDWLRREMAVEPGRSLVEASLRSALDFESWPNAGSSRPLTKAAIGVIVRLELRNWAPILARGLAPDLASATASDGGIRRSVQGALFQLFGRWFETTQQFAEAWPSLDVASAESLGLDALFQAHARADQSAATLMEFAPAEVGSDPLGLFNPEAAAEVARAAGRAVAGGRLAPEEVIELLGRGLSAEDRPVALHARIETMLDLVQGVDPDGPVAAGVRSAVLAVGQVAPGAAAVPADRAWIFLGSLRRLHYPMGPEGDAMRAETLAAGTSVLQAVLGDVQEQPLDPDGLKGAISALTDLARSIADPELRGRAARPLVVELYGLVGPDSAESIGVQRAAAKGLRLSLDRADAKELLRLLGGMGASEVEYELLGALRAAISVLEPGSEDAEAVIAELFLAVAGSEFDERARALGVLVAEDVRPALAAKRRDVRARWLLERIESENSPDLRRSLLDLLGRLGDPGTLEQLIQRSSLMELVVGDGAESVSTLGDCLIRLGMGGDRGQLANEAAVGDGRFARAARSLAEVRLPAQPNAALPARAFVLRESLRLMLAEGESGQASPWPRADQSWTVKATLEFLRIGPALGVRPLTPGEFRAILDGHIAPLAELVQANTEAGTHDRLAFDVHALRALIHARPATETAIVGAPGTPGDRATFIEATLADFERAIELCPVGEPSAEPSEWPSGSPLDASAWTRRALELECIGFLQASTRFEEALARFDRLFGTAGAEVDVPETTRWAEARAYIELVSASPSPALTPPRLARCLSLLRAFAERSSTAPPANRAAHPSITWLQDLLGPSAEPPTPLRSVLLSADGAAVLDQIDALFAEVDSDGD